MDNIKLMATVARIRAKLNQVDSGCSFVTSDSEIADMVRQSPEASDSDVAGWIYKEYAEECRIGDADAAFARECDPDDDWRYD